jgi:hypothetical protein
MSSEHGRGRVAKDKRKTLVTREEEEKEKHFPSQLWAVPGRGIQLAKESPIRVQTNQPTTH